MVDNQKRIQVARTNIDTELTRRGAVGALGSIAGLLALGCGVGEEEEHGESNRVQQVRQAVVGDSALLASGTIASGVAALNFASYIVSGWNNYELRLRNVYPQSAPGGSVYLSMQLSSDNGATWDSASCSSNCDSAGHYSYTTAFTVPGNASVFARTTGMPSLNAYDKEFKLTQQSAAPNGVCGSVRLSSPLATGVYKHFEWDTSYFGPSNFCRESGAGVWYGNPILSGSAYNAFRLLFTDINGLAASNFGGGTWSLWAYA